MKSREIISRLKSDGWVLVHVKGSHYHYKHSKNSGRVTVPHPKKDLQWAQFGVSIDKRVGLMIGENNEISSSNS